MSHGPADCTPREPEFCDIPETQFLTTFSANSSACFRMVSTAFCCLSWWVALFRKCAANEDHYLVTGTLPDGPVDDCVRLYLVRDLARIPAEYHRREP